MFDPTTVVSNGIQLMIVVFGLTEFFKNLFNLEGKPVTVMAASIGFIIMALFMLTDVLPEAYAIAFKIVLMSIVFGLSASGYYDFAKKIRSGNNNA